MNLITEHMISKSLITALIFCLLPASAVFGQQLNKEKLKGTNAENAGSNYAVFYSAGMPESAIWPLGMQLSKDGATIRHTHEKGNGNNTSVNDKVPFRFIIAPTEGPNTYYWAAAMGFHSGTGGDNGNLNPNGNFEIDFTSGCKGYSTTEFPSGWRLPTQREMMLLWLFQEGINAIYSGVPLTADKYWTATERTANKAWYMDFSATTPQISYDSKTSTYKFRCVRDY